MLKKLLLSIMAVCVCLSCFLFACNSGTTGPSIPTPPAAPETKLEFNDDSIDVEQYSSTQLSFTAQNITEELVFSSNNDVVIVDASGVITACEKGTAIVKVEAGSKFDTITVRVGDCDENKLGFHVNYALVNVYEQKTKALEATATYDGQAIAGARITFESANDAIATVNNGTVRGISKGMTEVSVTATIGSTTLGTKKVTVNVEEKVDFELNSYAQTIYLNQGIVPISIGDPETTEDDVYHETSFALVANVKLNDNDVAADITLPDATENAPKETIAMVAADKSIVDITPEGIILAKAVGTTEIVVSYMTAKDTFRQQSFTITVEKPVNRLTLDATTLYKNRATGHSVVLDASAYGIDYKFGTDYTFEEISSVAYGVNYLGASEFSVDSNGLATFAIANFKNHSEVANNIFNNVQNLVISAENDQNKFIFSQEIELYDYAIGSNDEFVDFMKAMGTSGTSYTLSGVLDNDFKYTAGKHTYSFLPNAYSFYLDGQGHNVDGVITRHGMFCAAVQSSTIKNISFTNVISGKGSSYTGSLLFNNGANNVVENVYMHVDFVKSGVNASATYACGIANYAKEVSINNVVINIEVPTTINGYTIGYNGTAANTKPASVNNFYSYSTTCVGVNNTILNDTTDGKNDASAGIVHYSDVKPYHEDAQSIVATLGEMWTVYNGMPMFKSAVGKIALEEDFTFNDADFITDGAEVDYKVPTGVYQLKSSKDNAIYELKEAVEGITVENGILTIGADVANDVKFTLKVTAFGEFYCNAIVKEITMSVVKVEVENVDGVAEVGKNRADAKTFVIESENIKANSVVEKVAIDGASLDLTAATIEDGKMTIDGTKLPCGENSLMITIVTDGAMRKFVKAIDVVDFFIADTTEFTEFLKEADKNERTVYAKVDADFTYTETRHTYTFINNANSIYIDGQGHTIDSVIARQGIFVGPLSNSTIKNIAFTNVRNSKASTAVGGLYWGATDTVLENVYMHVDFAKSGLIDTATYATAISFNNSGVTANNLVVNMEVPETLVYGTDSNGNGMGGYMLSYQGLEGQGFKSVSNFFSYSATAVGLTKDVLNDSEDGIQDAIPGMVHYSNLAAYKAAAADIVATLGEDWIVNEGMPMFKSAVQYLPVADTTIELNTDEFVVEGDKISVEAGSYQLKATARNATFVLNQPVEGVTLENGILTIDKSVAKSGAEIIIDITGEGSFYGNPLSAQVKLTYVYVENVTLEGTAQVAKNREATKVVSIDATEKIGDATAEVLGVVFGKNALDTSIVTIEDGIIKVNAAEFAIATDTLKVTIKVGDLTVSYFKTVDVVDFLIGTADEFLAWRDSVSTYVSSPSEIQVSYVAKLDADIDMTGKTFTKHDKNTAMVGSLDGQGHKVTGIDLSGKNVSLFYTTHNFTLKNVALYVATAKYYIWNTLSPTQTTNFINCYIEVADNPGGYMITHIGSLVNKMENCVMKCDYDWAGKEFFRAYNPNEITNTIVICTETSSGKAPALAPSLTPTNSGIFATADAVKADTTIDRSVFDTNYWTIVDGVPTWGATPQA